MGGREPKGRLRESGGHLASFQNRIRCRPFPFPPSFLHPTTVACHLALSCLPVWRILAPCTTPIKANIALPPPKNKSPFSLRPRAPPHSFPFLSFCSPPSS